MESVAETSEEFMDRYFAGEEFSVAEISAALAVNVGRRKPGSRMYGIAGESPWGIQSAG